MRMYELAYGCRIYEQMTGFDTAINTLRSATGGKPPDLTRDRHLKALLVWLNAWGCRQFAIDYHDSAAEEIRSWWGKWSGEIPTAGSLSVVPRYELHAASRAYGDLYPREASRRKRQSGHVSVVTVGPTGAAKILHALRPDIFPPWDDPIRKALGFDQDAAGYERYLLAVQDAVHALEREASALGFEVGRIPQLLGRPDSSLPKMIDEYHWATITRRCVPPAPELLARWNAWANSTHPSGER